MSSKDVAVSVRGLSKAYTLSHNVSKHTTAGEALMHRLKHPFQRAEKETFWALKDVEFDIQKGDVVGIIGRNGAGKSTLLKILSRITKPTTGQIDLYGRVGSLLEVGTGFHPELTGRENIFLNGAILGMRKREIERQFDAIVDFAGVEKFLDTPVKRYSSGMYVRLAFAVAAHLNPEILIVDEVLAVGDAEFQKKCLGKMQDVAESGRTVLFVSHHMESISTLCSRVILLGAGKVTFHGGVMEGIKEYMASTTTSLLVDQKSHLRKGTGELRYTEVVTSKEAFTPDEDKVIKFSIKRMKPFEGKYSVSCHVLDEKGAIVLHLDSRLVGYWVGASDFHSGELLIKTPWLKPGDYRVDCYIVSEGIIDEVEGACTLRIMPLLPYPETSEPLAGMYGHVLSDFSYI